MERGNEGTENSMELEEPKKEETYERRMVSVCA